MEEYNKYLKQTGEYGVVTEINQFVITANGLPHVRLGELVVFESGDVGQVFKITSDSIKITVFSKANIRVGNSLVRTDRQIEIPVGRELVGSIINPLGSIITAGKNYKKPQQSKELYPTPKALKDRSRVKTPFVTGVTIVDFLIPLGKGQKELVVGDRKVGKSSFFITTVKTQVQLNPAQIIIYVLIGKNKTDAKQIIERYRASNLHESMIFVLTTSDDPPSLISIAPMTAMTIAEYLRDHGIDSVVIFDDLTTHAKYYREITLVSGGFPGRESYPGDIFHVHAQLIETAGNFRFTKDKDVSITCFPIIETVEGDLTGYIPTNIMSMTDGHIFYDSNAYYNGRRPAIDASLSVTRVGKQTQTSLKREINHEVSTFLSEYEKSQNYSHFGAELSQKVKDIIRKGDLLFTFFDQHYEDLAPDEVQLVIFTLIWLNVMDKVPGINMAEFKKKLTAQYQTKEKRPLFQDIAQSKTMYELLTKVSQREQEFLSIWKISNESKAK